MYSALCGLCKPKALEENFAGLTVCRINEIASRKTPENSFVVKKMFNAI
jgi:hypothetical protein